MTPHPLNDYDYDHGVDHGYQPETGHGNFSDGGSLAGGQGFGDGFERSES